MKRLRCGSSRVDLYIENAGLAVQLPFLIIPEEIMTEEDEELMLDNFMTFFIAGEFLLFLLLSVKGSTSRTLGSAAAKTKIQIEISLLRRIIPV